MGERKSVWEREKVSDGKWESDKEGESESESEGEIRRDRGNKNYERERVSLHSCLLILCFIHFFFSLPSWISLLSYLSYWSILPDADKDFTLNAIAGAAFGAAGQRWEIFYKVI